VTKRYDDGGGIVSGRLFMILTYSIRCCKRVQNVNVKTKTSYYRCTKKMACSITCVHNYMERYARRCTGGRAPTCQDYARVHNGGPNGCRKSSTLRHWQKVKECC